jgi:hypothetical protein
VPPLRLRGSPHPFGASPGLGGVNFSLFSRNATGVELLLFAAHDAPEPFQVIRLDPCINKSFHFWHVFVRGLEAGAHYAYRVDVFNKRGTVISPALAPLRAQFRAQFAGVNPIETNCDWRTCEVDLRSDEALSPRLLTPRKMRKGGR